MLTSRVSPCAATTSWPDNTGRASSAVRPVVRRRISDSSALPVYLLSQATAKEVKVVLSGEGGDELFGGYLMYRATMIARAMPALMRKILFAMRPLARLRWVDFFLACRNPRSLA